MTKFLGEATEASGWHKGGWFKSRGAYHDDEGCTKPRHPERDLHWKHRMRVEEEYGNAGQN